MNETSTTPIFSQVLAAKPTPTQYAFSALGVTVGYVAGEYLRKRRIAKKNRPIETPTED